MAFVRPRATEIICGAPRSTEPASQPPPERLPLPNQPAAGGQVRPGTPQMCPLAAVRTPRLGQHLLGAPGHRLPQIPQSDVSYQAPRKNDANSALSRRPGMVLSTRAHTGHQIVVEPEIGR